MSRGLAERLWPSSEPLGSSAGRRPRPRPPVWQPPGQERPRLLPPGPAARAGLVPIDRCAQRGAKSQPPCPEAAIAQLGERQTEDLKVPGSIPGLGMPSATAWASAPTGAAELSGRLGPQGSPAPRGRLFPAAGFEGEGPDSPLQAGVSEKISKHNALRGCVLGVLPETSFNKCLSGVPPGAPPAAPRPRVRLGAGWGSGGLLWGGWRVGAGTDPTWPDLGLRSHYKRGLAVM